MADNIQEQTIDQNDVAAQQQQELAAQMAIALGTAPAPVQQEQIQDTQVQETQIQADVPVETPDFYTPLKEFGYEKPEDVVREIQEYRAAKANPTPAPITFENEQSEKIFKAIQSGQVKEVYSFLAEQEKLERLTSQEVTKDNATEILKLGMQLENKDLTPAEVEWKINKQYALPKEPTQALDEDDNEFEVRKSAWQEQVADITMSKIIDAKLAKPKLESSKSKLVLPEIQGQVDEDYIQYKQMLDKQAVIDEETVTAYKSLTPKHIETKINFNDEANKIAFEFQYEPDNDSFSKAVDMAADASKFFKTFENQDGSPNRQKFLETIYFALNKDKILMEAMKQAKNATIKASLPDNSNGGIVRQIPQTQELSELDKNMAIALNGYR
jgi:hypothetical protein